MMKATRRAIWGGNRHSARRPSATAAGEAAAFAEQLEPRLLLSHAAPTVRGRIDPAAVRAILARPVQKATSAQLAQIAQFGLAPIDWKGKQIFAERDRWVISVNTG